jgi:hypothetical protein
MDIFLRLLCLHNMYLPDKSSQRTRHRNGTQETDDNTNTDAVLRCSVRLVIQRRAVSCRGIRPHWPYRDGWGDDRDDRATGSRD